MSVQFFEVQQLAAVGLASIPEFARQPGSFSIADYANNAGIALYVYSVHNAQEYDQAYGETLKAESIDTLVAHVRSLCEITPEDTDEALKYAARTVILMGANIPPWGPAQEALATLMLPIMTKVTDRLYPRDVFQRVLEPEPPKP